MGSRVAVEPAVTVIRPAKTSYGGAVANVRSRVAVETAGTVLRLAGTCCRVAVDGGTGGLAVTVWCIGVTAGPGLTGSVVAARCVGTAFAPPWTCCRGAVSFGPKCACLGGTVRVEGSVVAAGLCVPVGEGARRSVVAEGTRVVV